MRATAVMVFLALALAQTSAQAADSGRNSLVLGPCDRGKQDNPTFTGCLMQELERLKPVVERYVEESKMGLRDVAATASAEGSRFDAASYTEAVEQFETSQSLWLAFRDAHCATMEGQITGSGRGAAPYRCKVQLTYERLQQIAQLGYVTTPDAVAVAHAVRMQAHTAMESGQDSSGAAADRQQIFSLVARWEENWNKHDMVAFGEQFHEDGVWVLWTGAVWTGRKAIADGHAEVHRTVFRNSTQRELVEELTFVSPDVALVRFCSMLHGDERAPGTFVRSRKVLLVTRRQGTWRVSLGQNTRLQESVPDSECFVALRKRFP